MSEKAETMAPDYDSLLLSADSNLGQGRYGDAAAGCANIARHLLVQLFVENVERLPARRRTVFEKALRKTSLGRGIAALPLGELIQLYRNATVLALVNNSRLTPLTYLNADALRAIQKLSDKHEVLSADAHSSVSLTARILDELGLVDRTKFLRWLGPTRAQAVLHNLPQPEYVDFIGRQALIKKIKDALFHGRGYIVSVQGIGGIGKTASSLHTAYQLLREASYDVIVWVTAKAWQKMVKGMGPLLFPQTSLDQVLDTISHVTQFSDLTRGLLGAEKEEAVKEVLRSFNCLVVFDNLETVRDDQVFRFIDEIPAPSKVLITTRHRKLEKGLEPVVVPPMEDEEAAAFVEAELRQKLAADSGSRLERILSDAGAIARICSAAERHPLAMKLVVGWIAHGKSVAAALNRLKQYERGEIHDFCFNNTYEDLSKAGRALFVAIPLCRENALEEELQAASGLAGPDFEAALGELEAKSLLERRVSVVGSGELASAEDTYVTSSLVRAFAEGRLGEQHAFRREARARLQEYLETERATEQEAERRLQEMRLSYGELGTRGERLAALACLAANTALALGNVPAARENVKKAIIACPDGWFAHATRAEVEWRDAEYEDAEEAFRQAEQLAPPGLRPKVLRRYAEMERLRQRTEQEYQLRRRIVEADPRDRYSWHRMGMYLARRDRLEEADAAFGRSVVEHPSSPSEKHHNAVTLDAKARNRKRLAESQSSSHEAVRLLREALRDCNRGLAAEPANERLYALKRELQRDLGPHDRGN